MVAGEFKINDQVVWSVYRESGKVDLELYKGGCGCPPLSLWSKLTNFDKHCKGLKLIKLFHNSTKKKSQRPQSEKVAEPIF